MHRWQMFRTKNCTLLVMSSASSYDEDRNNKAVALPSAIPLENVPFSVVFLNNVNVSNRLAQTAVLLNLFPGGGGGGVRIISVPVCSLIRECFRCCVA